MLLFKKVCIILMFLTATAACGFQPMYSSSGALNKADGTVASMPEIYVGNIPDKYGQFLRNILIDKYYANGRPSSYEYELKFSSIHKKNIEMGIQKDATATRIMVELSLDMKLIHNTDKGKETVIEKTIKTVGAHNLLTNQFASLVSKEDITEDLIKEMSDDIFTEVNLYFYNLR